MIVPACSTRRVLEMPPLGCWLACPVIWKLVLAYHNSAIKMRLCVAGCSSRGSFCFDCALDWLLPGLCLLVVQGQYWKCLLSDAGWLVL